MSNRLKVWSLPIGSFSHYYCCYKYKCSLIWMQTVHCVQVHCIKILEIECSKNDFLCLNACLSLFANNGDDSILFFFEDSYIFHLYGNLNGFQNLYPTLMEIKQWRIFNIQQLLWHRTWEDLHTRWQTFGSGNIIICFNDRYSNTKSYACKVIKHF